MVLNAKPPALVMLAGALWLTAVDLAWAESAGSNRERFVALVANRQNNLIAERLQNQLVRLNQGPSQFLQQQSVVAIKIANPPPRPSRSDSSSRTNACSSDRHGSSCG